MTVPALTYPAAPARCTPLAELFTGYTQTRPGDATHLAAQLAAVCAGCALLAACRADALTDPTIPGFAGGLTPRQRAAWRQRKARS